MTDALTADTHPLPGSSISNRTIRGRRAADTVAPSADPRRHMLWVHGGGYVAGTLAGYLPFASRLSDSMRRAVVLPEYRLAPEHPFPAAVDDVVAAITESLREDTELLVGGDSAGGGIVLAALMKLRDRGMLLPKGAAVICPFADLSLSGESWGAPETRDEIITAEPTAAVAAMYVSAAEASDPLVSPVFGDWEGLPPLLILASACESLRSDAERVAQHATAAGVPVRLLLWPDLPHDWPVHSPGLTASSEALTAIAEWAAPL